MGTKKIAVLIYYNLLDAGGSMEKGIHTIVYKAIIG